MTELPTIRPYEPWMSDAALDLEARSPQGRAFRLRFNRSTFHRRAENFDRWRLVTAWKGSTMVGVAGAALKNATFEQRPANAAYVFDVRVAPEERRTRLAKAMIDKLGEWVIGRADLTYGYTVGDNAAAQRLTEQMYGNAVTPACGYLVYPVPKRPPLGRPIQRSTGAAVHREYLARSAPFDLYFDPTPVFGTPPHVGSWTISDGESAAGASAWSNAGIMEEVVERLPASMRTIAAILERLPIVRDRIPRIPRRGESIRSWYLFDFHASDASIARSLVGGLCCEARRAGINYLYLIHHGDEPWIDALRRDTPRLLAPVIPYCIVGGAGDKVTPLVIRRPYIDIRDV